MAVLKACPTCGGLGCTAHTRKPWATRPARSTLSGWTQQRRAQHILDRDRTICHVCHKPGADQADHIIPLSQGGDDTVDNMAPIHHRPCHVNKTGREANQ